MRSVINGDPPRLYACIVRLALYALLLTSASIVYAQTITITPSYPWVPLGQTAQFTAQVTGLSSTDVIWSAGGKVGGTITAGTISPTGLYTAPATMPANAPQITATSKSNSSISATAYVYLLTQGPTITAVSPNPLIVGTNGNLTVTITGSGFQPGAKVVDTYGTTTVSMSTQSVTATSITAIGYQGKASSATFTVTNPGSAPSNPITVPISSGGSGIPYPVGTHPRLWLTVNDLPRLQSWAAPSNPVYAQGMAPLLQQALTTYNTKFFPNGVANPNYPDLGDVNGYAGCLTEQYGEILAFNSLIDPNPTNRIQYAQDARNLLMYAMNRAALGHLTGAPFRDPNFAIYNRANDEGEGWPLMVDWIYNAKDAQGNPILTAADKLTIRNVFMMWANDCLNSAVTGGDHPAPIGVTNNAQLLPNKQPYRMAANNFYLGHARLLTMMALAIDPNDDPPVNTSAPASQLGNSLRSYLLDANGAWLYQEFAMFGDPTAVSSAYGIANTGSGFGLASGGLPAEGMLYGHSLGFLLGQLLALQTAGFNNPAYSGPQIQLIGAPVWDRFVTGYISSLVPTPQIDPTQSWMGPIYEYASYGDLIRLWVTPDAMRPFALLALLEQQNGQNTHANAARWFAINACEGGSQRLLSRISNSWAYGTTSSILYYLLLDPTAAAAADPRPTFPTLFHDPAQGRIVAHSDWSANATMFDYRASWESINHQSGDAGQFELYRKGEWLTKEMSNYDSNELGITTVYHNSLALQNWCTSGTPNISWFEAGEWANGSQWILSENAGDPTTLSSSGPGYVYIASDLTNLYNHPNIWLPNSAPTDIVQATRSILWLNNDYIVIYDRATSQHTGLFKRFNLSLVNSPAISGNVATETMQSGQQLFIQTLLPHNPALAATYAASNLTSLAQMEPTRYVLTVQDPTLPADMRFLHVLQGADAGAAMVSATYLQSTQGTAFDGAVFGSTAVYFPVSTTVQITATTFTVPSGVHTLLVAGLTANASYGVSTQTVGGKTMIVVTPSKADAISDGAGLLRLTF